MDLRRPASAPWVRRSADETGRRRRDACTVSTLPLPSARLTAALGVVGLMVAALASPLVPAASAAGAAPTVNVGADEVITVADRAFLNGQVSDDGLPAPSELLMRWSVLSGPGTVTVARRDEAHTSATFGSAGTYVLRLAVSDGDATATDDLAITVRDHAENVLRVPADYPTIQSALDAAP